MKPIIKTEHIMNYKLILKTFFLFFSSFITQILNAQVNIEFTSVNEYSFSTKEALNLIATNGNTKSFNVIFNGNIKDANGNLVVEFKTHETTLNIGANIFTPQNLSLAEVNYSNTDIAEIEMSSGSFPSGNYTICIWASCVTPDCSGVGQFAVGMEQPKCLSVHIENPTPLILAFPENEAEIEETRPLYFWIPPAPVAGSANLNYTLILVELLDGQSKADALTINRPLIEKEGIGVPSLMHPSDLPELEKGKWYAWQVEALVGQTPIAKSEQWKFRIKKITEKKDTFRYARLSDVQTTSFYSIPVSSLLCIAYEGAYSHLELNFSVFDDHNKPLKPIHKTVKTEIFRPGDDSLSLVSFGDNKYILDLAQLPLEIGKYYNFIVLDGLRRKFYLRILTVSDKK